MRPIDYEKVARIRELSNIPPNMGEQFIQVDLNLTYGDCGIIRFGFKHKLEMGEIEFYSMNQCITQLIELRKKANLSCTE